MDTYEKKYKEALELARVAAFNGHQSLVEGIFPELKESEDERIRKAIHIYLDWLDGRNKDYQPKGDYSINDMIAWLEKQGEQKSQRMISAEAKEAMYDKPAWSEENETGWTNTMIMIKEAASKHYAKNSIRLVTDWLKSIRKRIEGE